MEDLFGHPTIKWCLIIVAFFASFQVGWTALEYINRAPEPIPRLDYKKEMPELPVRGLPAILVDDRPWRSLQQGEG